MHRECKHPTCGDTCRRVSKAKAKKPIKKVSDKQSKKLRTYSAMRKAYLEFNSSCKASLVGCAGASTDIHHMVGRVGERMLDTTTWIAVCRNCHRIIEDNPTFAKNLNLSKKRNT